MAGAFHWAPSELDNLELEDLLFWYERAKDWSEWQQKSSP